MSQVKQRNTKPELLVFSELEKLGVAFEKHFSIHGKPDIVIRDLKVAVFINGEFWHGRNYQRLKLKLNDYWREKISKNMDRDKKNYRLLKADGWKVLIIWDKDLDRNPTRQLEKITRLISME